MRAFIIALVLAVSAISGVSTSATANAATIVPALVAQMSERQQQVDDNGDTRVEVQLVVLGAAVALVPGVGIGAYLLRRRLGLVPPPPDASSDAHH